MPSAASSNTNNADHMSLASADLPSSNAQHHRNIERAARTKHILEPFGKDFDSYTPPAAADATSSSSLTTYCKWKADMDAKALKWAFRLAETNVGPFYKTCSLGWQPKQKQSDLNKNWARYLVLSERATKRPVAYAMFRFDMDYGCSVLYCYELQIEKDHQRKGIGRFLIGALERTAKHYQMEKLILTVLSNNQNAIDFFTKMGFAPDDTSPSKSEASGYEILSKRF